MKKSRAAAVLVISVILLSVIFQTAYASDADYTFNAPDWLTKSSINGNDCWITVDNLAVIEIKVSDNTDNLSVRTLTPARKQEFESSIRKALENSADSYSGPFKINSVELTDSAADKKCGYDAFRTEYKASMTYFNVSVEAAVKDYVFISKDHIIIAEFVTYRGNGVTGAYSMNDLISAFDDGFTINESMPSVIRDIIVGILLATAVITGVILVIRVPAKKKKPHKAEAVTEETSGGGNTEKNTEDSGSEHITMLREDYQLLVKSKAMYENGAITKEEYTKVYNHVISKYR